MALRQTNNHMQRNEAGLFTPSKKLIQNELHLNVRTKTIKLLEENTEVNLHDLEFVK